MVTLFQLYTDVKEKLKASQIENYQFESRQLTEHFLHLQPHDILNKKNDIVDESMISALSKAVLKRCEGYPLQYLIGIWEFYGYPFEVGEGVLIPRQDTETLIDAILEENTITAPGIADLCSGSGCIAITLKKEIPLADIYAVEKSDSAFPYLNKNIDINNVQINAVYGDIFDENIIKAVPKVDILVSNPPYLTADDMNSLQKEVKSEPESALYGGDDGLYFYRKIPKVWKNKISDGGMIIFEIGINQQNDVKQFLSENSFRKIKEYKDLNGIVRAVSAIK